MDIAGRNIDLQPVAADRNGLMLSCPVLSIAALRCIKLCRACFLPAGHDAIVESISILAFDRSMMPLF